LGGKICVLAVLVGAIPDAVSEVLPGAEASGVDTTAKIISQREHVADAGLSAFREALRELGLSCREGNKANDGGGGLHGECVCELERPKVGACCVD
jgi:hypothetical protein